jgi:lipopolysaccharide export LptBFGC system permease protein LptF
MKNLLLILLISCASALAQVSTITRHPSSYTQDVFAYKGSRILQVDEVSSPGNEDNVFIFSKVEKYAKPDVMYFQRFTKSGGQWRLAALTEIRYDGIISTINNRKAFTDVDKNKSIDGLFIYALNDATLTQQSIHLLFSQDSKIYTVAAAKSDNYMSNKFSDNFAELSPNAQNAVIAYWNKLDKADK